MSLRDVLVNFYLKVDGKDQLSATSKELSEATKRAKTLGKELAGIGAVFAGGSLLIAGAKAFINNLVEQADQLKHNAEALGISADELQKYQYVAGAMQVPVQQTAVALRFFNRAVGEASFGTKSASKVFAQLGVAVKDSNGQVKPTNELLFEVADKLKGVHSQAERTAIAMRLLGRGGAAMLPVLQNGSAELRKMFEDVETLGGGFDKDFIEKAHDLDIAGRRLSMGWRSMGVALVKELFPYLKAWADRGIENVKLLIDWAKKTNGLATGIMFLKGVVVALMAWWAALRIAFLAANPEIAAAVAGFTALVAVLTFIYNVFDDLYTFVTGGDSLIGRMLDQIGGNGTALQFWKDITAAFKAFQAAMSDGDEKGKTLRQTLFGLLEGTLPLIVKWGGKFTLGFLELLDTAITGVRTLIQLMGLLNPFTSKTFGQQLNEIDKTNAAWEKRMRAFNAGQDALDSMGRGGGSPTAPAVPGLPAGYVPSADEQNPGASLNGKSRGGARDPLSPVTIQNNIVVHGSADPKAVGDAAAEGTQNGLQKHQDAQDRDTYDALSMGLPLTGS